MCWRRTSSGQLVRRKAAHKHERRETCILILATQVRLCHCAVIRRPQGGKMTDFISNLQEILNRFRRQESKAVQDNNHDLAQKHAWAADALESAIGEIKRLRNLTTALPEDLGDITDLPEELIAELSVAKGDELEDRLVTVINSYGGTADLDQILVGLYRKFKDVQKRRFLQNKLYRMTQKAIVWSVPKRKGVYTTTKLDDGESGQNPFEESGKRDLDEEIPF